MLRRTRVQPEPLIQRLEAILPDSRQRGAIIRRLDLTTKAADANLYERALAIAIASEAWARGTQTIFVTADETLGLQET